MLERLALVAPGLVSFVLHRRNPNGAVLPGFPGQAPGAINDAGVMAGSYQDANHVNHGYVLAKGQYTTLDDPVAGTGPFQGTVPDAINNGGVIATNSTAYVAKPLHPSDASKPLSTASGNHQSKTGGLWQQPTMPSQSVAGGEKSGGAR